MTSKKQKHSPKNTSSTLNGHNKLIMDQFSRQAVPFSQKVPAHSNEAAFKLIIKTIGIGKNDTVLDVACGPGMLTSSVAQKAHKITGIDLVPAMIRQARLLQRKKKLSNMDWKIGDVTKLPFEDGKFSAVLTRFSFHHFLKPKKVLNEMIRVAGPKGKIGIIDVFTKSQAHSKRHNLLEKLRDDSHVKALSLKELQKMAQDAGLTHLKTCFYRLEIELEQQLSASFPKQGNADKIRNLVLEDKEGLISCQKGRNTYLVYPIAVISGKKQ